MTQPIAPLTVDVDEALRYMGTPPELAPPQLRALTQDCARQVLAAAAPRWTYRVFSLTLTPDGVQLDCGLTLPGQALREHLSGCDRVCLFCATLGPEVDRLIRRAECTDMALALGLDCCASAAAESLCDQIEGRLHALFPGCHFPYRFSPGYGDLPLELNTPLLALLDAQRKTGLCAAASHLLTPRKSVTALLGVSDHPIQTPKRSCLGCPAHEGCRYRKSGGYCGIL